jgi:hypothetical protein
VNPLSTLASFALDAYLLARYTAGRTTLPGGHAWERTIAQLLCRPGLESRQYAGLTTLFGRHSASHCGHEIDGAARGWIGCLLLEAKSKTTGITKADIAVFGIKTFDYYVSQTLETTAVPWWRLIVSAGPVAPNLRRLCLHEGILLCDPRHMPLPTLLHVASKPNADQFLDELKLAELVRLAEPACEPLQERWRIQPNGAMMLRLHRWTNAEIDDLLWLQEELTGDVMDLYDTLHPGALERRIEQLISRLKMAQYV